MQIFVGRSAELALLRGRHAEAASGSPRLVIAEGAAGVGKTSLVQAFTAELDHESVLRASGDEAERFLRFGVLGQLLGSRETNWADPFAAGARLLEMLDDRTVQADPTVFVVDDAHLADTESMAALTFALRRLRADRVLAVVTVRSEDTVRLPPGLLRLADSQDGRLVVQGLSSDDVVELGAATGQGELSRQAAERLRRHTDGSPLHLRALLQELGTEELAAPGRLPAPQTYVSLVLASVASRSDAARRLVRAAAVMPDGSALGVVAQVADISSPEEVLDELVSAHLLTCTYADDGWRVGMAHPLARAAVYDDLGPRDRRRLHLRAARQFDGDDALYHRIAAASGPDAELAANIAARAEALEAVGDVRKAAEFYLRAGRLGDGGGEPDRLMDAAALFLIAGDVSAAKAAEESVPEDVGGASRVYLKAKIAWFGGQPGLAADLATLAWERADELDRSGRGGLAAILAQLHNMQGDGLGAAAWAERALAEDLPADLTDATAAARAVGLVIAGQPAVALEALGTLPSDPRLIGPDRHHQLAARGALRAATDDLDGARRDLEALHRSSPSDLAPQRLLAMGVLAEVAYRLGEWESSQTLAEQGLSLAEDSEQVWVQGYLHAAAVLAVAGRGSWSRAGDHLAAGRQLAAQLGDPVTWAVCENVAVHVALCRGEPEEVVSRSELLHSLGGLLEEPGWLSWPVHRSSALVQLGRLDEAEQELLRLETVARDRGSRSRLAALARVRGELATARREHTPAREAFDEALALSGVADALEQALLRVSYGRFLRRRGERRAARVQLEDAHDRLRVLAAAPFLAGCSEELAACGVSTDEPARSVTDRLTPQEQIVVRLACEGLTNQEVARQLVLSVKTVSYHLANAYSKLGVHSRAQLAALMMPAGT